jgi:peroxin-3
MEREERRREQERSALQSQLSLAMNLGIGSDLSSRWYTASDDLEYECEPEDVDGADEETERMYLTLSWWILHVGWKDVSERARRAVEEVFTGVSLKTHLTAMELHRLIHDVRRRVEYEVTFEGTERRIKLVFSP